MNVELTALSKAFCGVPVFADLSIEIPSGSLAAILGPSGCGKSTLLRAIAGLERLDAGRVVIDGRDVTRWPVRRRNVGFVFQAYALFPHLDVRDNVGFGLRVRGIPYRQRMIRIDELLAITGLAPFAYRLPHELSGGQRQRVALARALVTNPSLLLLDEPFAALDSGVRASLRAWLRELHDRTHVTTLMVTHDAAEAEEVADLIVTMEHGRVSAVPRMRTLALA